VAQREVVLHRIVGIQLAQRRGDLSGHRPAGADVARQAQAAPDADHVRVERHDQLGGRHARPDAEVERVAPHHPAQEQVEPLAAGAGGRTRKKVADTQPSLPACPERARGRASRRAALFAVRSLEIQRERTRGKAVECLLHVAGCRVVLLREKPFDRAGAIDHLAHQPQ